MIPVIFSIVLVAGATANYEKGCDNREYPMCVQVPGKNLAPKPQPYDCNKCRAEAFAFRLTDKNIHIPSCNKDNSFRKLQYDATANESFCVTKYGEEIPKSRKKGRNLDCSKFKEPAKPPTHCEAKRARALAIKAKYVPQCNKDKDFDQIQCYAKTDFCWCAMSNGIPIPYTFFSKKKGNPPNCKQHRDTVLNCKGKEGVFKHPFDCKRYLQCGANSVYSCLCPKGQAFNLSLRVCDWIANVKGCPPKGGKTPPPTKPSVTKPPATKPPPTKPPATKPPITKPPPPTKPPVTKPPATKPPITKPPATKPPATKPPATKPPVTKPPATKAPATQAPPRKKRFNLISFAGGKPGASSWLDRNHIPRNAFALGRKGLYRPWANKPKGPFPHTVYMKFPRKVRVARFSFSSRDRINLNQSPTEFDFVGSNNCKSWKKIKGYKTKFQKLKQNKRWTIPTKLRRSYRCFGIRVKKVSKGRFAAIKHMKMFAWN